MEDRWSDAQMELLFALGKICQRVGPQGAEELLREDPNGWGTNAPDRRGFVAELMTLREKAGAVDGLERMVVRLRAELDVARGQLLDGGFVKGKLRAGAGEGGAFARRSMATQTESNSPDEGDDDQNLSYGALLQKYNVLTRSYQELVPARDQLENKLRSAQKSSREWVEYANGLEKKIGRLHEKLAGLAVPSKRRSEGRSFENLQPALPASSRELVPVDAGNTSLETPTRELPHLQHMSERILELARSTAVRTQVYESQGDSGIRQAQLPSSNDPIRLPSDPSASNGEISTSSPKPLTEAATRQHCNSANAVSPEPPDSGSTVEHADILPDLSNREEFDLPPLIIKLEPLSDTPVVISSRNIKKRKTQNRMESQESVSYSRVKVEIISSSPDDLAGFQSRFPQESLDLDEIGEKMNTPKKRRRAMQNAQYGGNAIAHDRFPVGFDQAGSLQQSQGDSQPKGNPLALQPASPNKQVLPRTSGNERGPKRRRLIDRMYGATIFGEDGENDETPKKSKKRHDPHTETILKIRANAADLKGRLSSLLEGLPFEKEVLTPLRPAPLSTATAQSRARAPPKDKSEKPTPSNRHQMSGGTTPQNFSIPRDTPKTGDNLPIPRNIPKTGHKPSTAKKQTARTPKDAADLEADDSDQGPLRSRPLHRLGLEHFKINTRYNQGSDYAYSEVIRGRAARKCLPGCTEPSCCGASLRAFIDFSRAAELQQLQQQDQQNPNPNPNPQPPTPTQTSTDTRLLAAYVGEDAHHGPQALSSPAEREELLLRARTWDLANRAGKHRHRYERRRSPPGFWRADFPNTQEGERDRREAERRERVLVEGRWVEALRGGGRWVFGDE